MANLRFSGAAQVQVNRDGRRCGWLHSDAAKLWPIAGQDAIVLEF